MSTPQMSNPITLEILSAEIYFQDVMSTSTEVPPVLKLVDFKEHNFF
jgi:hypothetical protein